MPLQASDDNEARADPTGPFSGYVDFGGARFPITANTIRIMDEFATLGAVSRPDANTTWCGFADDGLVRGPALSVMGHGDGFTTSVDDTEADPAMVTPPGEDPTRRFGAPIPAGGTYQTVSGAVHAALAIMTERVVRLEPDRLHLHAGTVVVHGTGILIPADSGVGKTTLVTELAHFGGVVTDELVAVDRAAGVLRAPRRPLAVKNSGFARMSDRYEHLTPPDDDEFVWHLDLDAIGLGHIGTATPGVILIPERRPGSVDIEPVEPGAALLALVDHSYDLDVDPSRAFDDLIWLVSSCHCIRVSYGEAADVADPLTTWLDAHRGAPAVTATRIATGGGTVLAVRLGDTEVHWDTGSRDLVWVAATP